MSVIEENGRLIQKKVYLRETDVEEIERYRSAQRPIPSFAHAIVELVRKGLHGRGKPKVVGGRG